MAKIIHNRILGGWYIVRGPHHTPIGGRFDSKAEAEAFLELRKAAYQAFADHEHDMATKPEYRTTVNKIQARKDALAKVNQAIEAGREWPDVAARIARKHGITYASLSRAYDNQ